MKQRPGFKRSIFPAIVLLFVACFFVSCFNKSDEKIIPGKYNPNGNGSTGTTGTTGASGTTTGDSTSTTIFSSPDDVAVDVSGNIYVADFGDNRIEKITPGGLVTTLAGTGNAGAINGIGNLASFNGPSGVAVDAGGNVYVADSRNNLIRKITSAGVVSTFAGTIVVPDTTGTVTVTGPTFSGPSGVAVDASGNVYVADAGDNQIRMITPAGVVSTLAGSGGVGADNGAGATATFNNPTGVAVDGAGNVYVADFLNNEIRKIVPGGVVSTLAGNGNIGSADGVDTTATFYFPNSLAVDASGNVFVTDDINNLIREITPGGTVSTIAGSGVAGSANGLGTLASFNDPAGIAVDALDNLYIADANNNQIRKINATGMVSTLAGTLPPLGLARSRHLYFRIGIGLQKRPQLKSKLR